jgi:hypothetical protein
MKRTDANAVKNFLSQGEDHTRKAYDRAVSDFPRQFIPIGTTNDKNYLTDPTGNTRFWPGMSSETGAIDVGWIERNVDQLWAEAAHYEALGESIELDPSLYDKAAREQQKREQIDPWVDALASLEKIYPVVVNGKLRVHSLELMRIVLGVKFGDPTPNILPSQYQRLADVMRKMGWDGPKQVMIDGRNLWGFVRKVETQPKPQGKDGEGEDEEDDIPF